MISVNVIVGRERSVCGSQAMTYAGRFYALIVLGWLISVYLNLENICLPYFYHSKVKYGIWQR